MYHHLERQATHVLKSVGEKHCAVEAAQDSTHFIQEVKRLEDDTSYSDPCLKIVTLLVDTLFRNIGKSLQQWKP